MRPLLLLLATLCHLTAANVVLVHGDTELTVALPDPTGLGTRYDPTSMAPSARWRGHSLFAFFTHPNYPETNTTAGFAEEYDTGESSLPPGWKQSARASALLPSAPA